MRIAAIGKKEILVGFALAGVKERLETYDSEEALGFLHELEESETAFLVIIESEMYDEIEQEIEEMQARKPSFMFYRFVGGGLDWRSP